MILNQFGSIPHDLAMENIKLTTQKVLPNLRHIWDGQWEDKWWIHPSGNAQMPGPLLSRGAVEDALREAAPSPAGD